VTIREFCVKYQARRGISLYVSSKRDVMLSQRNGIRWSNIESGRKTTEAEEGGGGGGDGDGEGREERERRSLDLIFRMKDSSSRAFTRSTRAFQRLPEYEQEMARDDNAEELNVTFLALYLSKREKRKRAE